MMSSMLASKYQRYGFVYIEPFEPGDSEYLKNRRILAPRRSKVRGLWVMGNDYIQPFWLRQALKKRTGMKIKKNFLESNFYHF